MTYPETRRVGALDQAGHACVIEQPMPELKKGTVLVQVHCSLISPGTELNGAKQARKDGQTDPGEAKPFGYQNAGVVAALGPDTVTDLQIGDRVACMGAGYAQHADFAVVPVNLCSRLPGGISFEQGAAMSLKGLTA